MKTHSILPLNFDQKKLLEDLTQVSNNWMPHFNSDYYDGNWSGIVLRGSKSEFHTLSAGNPGTSDFEDFPVMEKIPYTKSALDTLKTEKLSVRYLRLKPGSRIKPHQDHDIVYWDGMVRLHIPVMTNQNVIFIVDGQQVEMQAGECWFADFSKTHSVENNGTTDRVHLVIDCQVNDWLKRLFINEGIIEQNEEAPDPVAQFPEESKMNMISALREMGTETSLQLAADMEKKFNLTSSNES